MIIVLQRMRSACGPISEKGQGQQSDSGMWPLSGRVVSAVIRLGQLLNRLFSENLSHEKFVSLYLPTLAQS